MAEDKKSEDTPTEKVEQGKDEKNLATRKKKNTKEKVYNNRIEVNPKLKEEAEIEEALDRQQRRQRAITMRRYKSKIAAGRRKAARRPASMDKLKKRARKRAIETVRKKVAQKQGQNYATLDASQKALIDKKVEKRKALVDRLAKKFIPQVRQAERQRMARRRSVDEQFEAFLESAPTKRFHQARKKDGSIKLDRRFRAFKKAPVTEQNVDRLRDTHKAERQDLKREQEREMDRARTNQLQRKIQKINREFVEYEDDAELLSIIEKVEKSKDDPCWKGYVQLGTKKKNGKEVPNCVPESLALDEKPEKDKDDPCWKGYVQLGTKKKNGKEVPNCVPENRQIFTLDEQFEIQFLDEESIADKALAAIHRHVMGGEDLMDVAFQVSRARGVNIGAHSLVKMYKDKYPEAQKTLSDLGKRISVKSKKFGMSSEQFGAGFEGTDTAIQNFKADTPGEKGTKRKPKISDWSPYIKEAKEGDQCTMVTVQQMKQFEKVLDKLFEKIGIDFEFTKHFRERMSHERNDPCITLKELADFMKKMYLKKGKPLKGLVGAEAVLNDMQRDLNIPVVIKYDERNDEIDVVMKTIMRKKNFRSPDKFVRY